jgi:hypothetical protein
VSHTRRVGMPGGLALIQIEVASDRFRLFNANWANYTNGANKIFFDKENHMHFSFLLKMLILIRFA